MFLLQAEKTKLALTQREQLTSGSANVYRCRFEFSEDWEGMAKVACFRSGSQTVSVLLDESGKCVIPWEVTGPDSSGKRLAVGVYGTRDGGVALPTVWADLGEILKGVNCCCTGSRPPAPGLYEQVLAALEGKQDALHGLPGQVVGFDEGGNAVPVDMPSGGGEGGAAYEFGHGLKQAGYVVSVDAVDDFAGDNTLPMTAAGVQAVVGNIDVLLGTI